VKTLLPMRIQLMQSMKK